MNGVEGIFKVYPVQMVDKKSKLKKENGRNGHYHRNSSVVSSFDELLETAKEENAPAECYTVTYTADRRLQTYFYHASREYTF